MYNKMTMPKFEVPKTPDLPTHHMWADTQFEIIRRYILEFQNSLDDEHEVGVMLTNFGQSILMEITNISYEKSVLMVFKGFVNERVCSSSKNVSKRSPKRLAPWST